jgi:PAS domain S-box-containing protein
MFKEKPFLILLFGLVVITGAAVLQYLNPEAAFFDGGFIIAVLLTVLLKKDDYTVLFGAVSFFLVFLPIFYPHGNYTAQQVFVQHVFSGTIIVAATMAVLHIKKLYRSIESDQSQTNALFEYATEGIILANGKGEIVLINPAALRLFHYEKGDVIGKPVELLIPSRFHSAHHTYRGNFYKHPSNRTMGHGRELFAKTKSGTEFPVEVSLSFYKQKDDFFVIAFIVDITLRKQSELEQLAQKNQLEKITADVLRLNAELENKVEERTMILKEALQQLENSQEELHDALNKEKELNEIKSRFVSMASHEFRTPLSTVLSSAALISRYTKEEEQPNRDKHTKRIKESVKHLNDLLEDFLSLGKLEEGKIMAQISSFNVKDFLEEVTDEMKLILKPGQTIDVKTEGNGIAVTDRRFLKNILINLLSNAIKFSKDGGVMELDVVNSDNGLTMAVKDHGIGISEDDQQHLFSSFFRGKNAVNIQGTGLGLHIVKRYTELINARLQLHSVLGEGTTITVIIPAPAGGAM